MIEDFFRGVEPGCTPPAFCPHDARVGAAAAVRPGVQRLALLSRIDPNGLNSFDRVEVLGLWEQCQSWLAAGQAEAMAAAAGFGDWSGETESSMEAARVALVAAGPSPRRNPLTAMALTAHPIIAARLREGLVSYEQVHAVLDELGATPLDVARIIAADLLDADAVTTRPADLRRETRRRVIAADPITAELEAERLTALRQVRKRAGKYGQAELTVRGPATGIATVWTALDLAASVTTAGDDRTLDQRRFDALAEIAGAWISGTTGGSSTTSAADTSAAGTSAAGTSASRTDRASAQSGRGRGARRGLRPTVYLYADARTWAGLTDDPVDLDGHGPIPAGMARTMFTDAEFRIVVTDAITGAARAVSDTAYRPTAKLRRLLHVTDRTCGFPGCGAAVWFCDAEHSTAHDQGGATDACNCGLVCRRHHRLKTHHGWNWYRDHVGRTVWITPAGQVYHRDPVRYLAEEADADQLRRWLRDLDRPPRPPLPDPAPVPSTDAGEPPPF